MQCMNCKGDVPPAWVHAIQTNTCPGCGGAIMDDAAKELLTQLRDAMTKMPNDPEGVAGWLMSTYDLFPKGTVEPTKFHRKLTEQAQTQGQGGAPGTHQLVWANSPSFDFMKRAGADKVLKDPKLAAIAQAISSVQGTENSMYGDQQPDPEDVELTEEEQQLQMQQQMQQAAKRAKASGKRLTVKDALANNTIFNMGENSGPPLTEEETATMKEMIGGDGADLEGLADLPPILQADRLKRLAKQRDLVNGGSTGLVKRST